MHLRSGSLTPKRLHQSPRGVKASPKTPPAQMAKTVPAGGRKVVDPKIMKTVSPQPFNTAKGKRGGTPRATQPASPARGAKGVGEQQAVVRAVEGGKAGSHKDKVSLSPSAPPSLPPPHTPN